ncbi:hypothetical protein Pcinc_034704 [Petrolisthes cinctipes]|uniref:Uncharacterized protein n=1 Tax=Petrolisthes cinctipes TaxID=88211 RepID=A0AAE1C1U9_PETCI|nr:hypothetical protein Pcinc_034704 [Petrolisthes cinctipes]
MGSHVLPPPQLWLNCASRARSSSVPPPLVSADGRDAPCGHSDHTPSRHNLYLTIFIPPLFYKRRVGVGRVRREGNGMLAGGGGVEVGQGRAGRPRLQSEGQSRSLAAAAAAQHLHPQARKWAACLPLPDAPSYLSVHEPSLSLSSCTVAV